MALSMKAGSPDVETIQRALEAKLIGSLTPMATVSRARRTRKPAHGVCRLVLTINGTSYNVRPILAGSSNARKAFRLRETDGTLYHVADTVHGLQCDCPDFLFHRDGLDVEGCKHVKAMVACGLFERKGGAK